MFINCINRDFERLALISKATQCNYIVMALMSHRSFTEKMRSTGLEKGQAILRKMIWAAILVEGGSEDERFPFSDEGITLLGYFYKMVRELKAEGDVAQMGTSKYLIPFFEVIGKETIPDKENKFLICFFEAMAAIFRENAQAYQHVLS